ncbi:MAG: hypothetical protein WC223_10735 [Bacteroidales bacterium]|jgi:hypothetical protein
METNNIITGSDNPIDSYSFFKISSGRHINLDNLHYLAYVINKETLKKDRKKQNIKTL